LTTVIREGALSACTIISKNYLAYARVLGASFLRHHPDGRFFVLLVDEIDGSFDRDEEPFDIITLAELGNIPELTEFVFKYTILECNTATKPFFLEYLLDTYGLPNVVYLDPDIQVFRRLDELHHLVCEHSIVVTPHMTEPVDDGRFPGEIEILLGGAYNLGFIGVKNTATTHRFLSWWQERLYDRCINDQPGGVFVDQRWIDLVPGFFKDVHILTEPGYNVAYWNLHERHVRVGSEITVNEKPLYFFHFSGINLNDLDAVSRHQNRFSLNDLGDTASLFARYREQLLAAGHEKCSTWRYAYGTYDDGSPIRDEDRKSYRELRSERARFDNPFQTGTPESFKSWHSVASLPPVRRWAHRLGGRVAVTPPVLAARRAWWNVVRGRKKAKKRARASIVPGQLARPGVNLIGYFDAESGMGEVARGLARSLASMGISCLPHNVSIGVHSRRGEEGASSSEPPDFRYDVNVFCVNADQVPAVTDHFGKAARKGRLNVGFWLWELSAFPDRYEPCFDYFDEIWTPSSHCAEALSAVSSIPVRRVPLPVNMPTEGRHERAHFGIPEGDFALLFAFDFLSFWERKNPLAVIEAFKLAFASDEPVRLVLKSSNSTSPSVDPSGREKLEKSMQGMAVTWLDETLSRQEVRDLFRVCDCYVSLHRAEGFGLTIAEAMAMGKPVVATGYSGNVDFFNLNNGWPVQYDLVEIDENVGPYDAGTVWAEPDVAHAAQQMRSVYTDSAEREKRTRRARSDIQEQLSDTAVGEILVARLKALARHRKA